MPCLPEQIIILTKIVMLRGQNEQHWMVCQTKIGPLIGDSCCCKAASTALLTALIEAEGSVLDDGPSGSGNRLGLKYRLSDIKALQNIFALQR